MARPRIRQIPVSRAIAENLVIGVAGEGEAVVDASSVRMLLTLLSRAAPWVPDTDEEAMHQAYWRQFYNDEERYYEPLFLGVGALREDLGRAGLAVVKALMPKVAAMRVGFMDEPRYGLHPPCRAMMVSAAGGRVYRDTAVATVAMEITLRAAAIGHVQCLWVDTRALRRFRCRYSAVLYLRALASLQRPPVEAQAVKTARNGKLWFEVPYAQAQAFLGVSGFKLPSNLMQTVMEPAMRELAQVGVDLTLKWVTDYKGRPTRLRVGVASTEEVRRRALAELARRRAATVAARRAARRERRIEAIRQAGGSTALARLRYLPRRRCQPAEA